jgi:hypothetical protein
MMDDPTIYDTEEFDDVNDDEFADVHCSSPNCSSVSPTRFLRILNKEDLWLCIQCLESNPLKKLQFLINNASPGNGGLNWLVTEPPYGPYDRQRYKMSDDEMWFTVFVGVPFSRTTSNFTPCWTDVRFIMKKPCPSLYYP